MQPTHTFYSQVTCSTHAEEKLESMMQSTSMARASLPGPTAGGLRAGTIPLPRRFARAKAWSARSRAGHVSVDTIKLMLSAERANRG